MHPIADISENEFHERHPEALKELLKDHSTGKNIIWATGSYSSIGEGFGFHDTIEPEKITGKNGLVIVPRAVKSKDEQDRRVRNMAEVFTPSWLCNRMNNHLDEEWFGVRGVFNEENPDHSWTPSHGKISLPEGKNFKDYVSSRILEITCGEAPFLVSRYDTVTGEAIALDRRIGILDRKLRVVGENAADEEEWARWALIALGSCYGYEWQGDSLLLAREAVVETFVEYYERHFQQPISGKLLAKAAEIVSWNLWQMDGLKGVVPGSCHEEKELIVNLFGEPEVKVTSCAGCASGDITRHNGQYCQLRRWIADDKSIMPAHFDFSFLDIITKKYKTYHKTKWLMKFDFIIGNPPYQEKTVGGQKAFMSPIYDRFMDATYLIGDKVELVTPARFLFNAGSTPTAWNKKMLSDSHFKVLLYESDCSKVFNNTEIKGGVAVSYRDSSKDFGPIKVFTPYQELNSILHKVISRKEKKLSDIAVSRTAYRLTDLMHKENPNALSLLSDGHPYDMSTNIFDLLPFIFFDNKPNDGKEYIKIIGRQNNERTYKYIRKDYVNEVINLNFYKIIFPKASGVGTFGEVLPDPILGEPNLANTETFFSIGRFSSQVEAINLSKYIKTKFSRTLLGLQKVTQDITPSKFQYVPLQDFTSSSDIDWSKSIHEIDLQLYDKYGLADAERGFIETHVEPME